jgi:alginate O-acetyltransferase complex protein AlgI
VLHHAQMMPQFAELRDLPRSTRQGGAGLTIFVFGLAKKLLIADPHGQYADLMFNGVHASAPLVRRDGWLGVLPTPCRSTSTSRATPTWPSACSMCLGVQLPLNFRSPYQATSIIEFWRRWHISLSTFLRDYLYVPLGGNRKGRRGAT